MSISKIIEPLTSMKLWLPASEGSGTLVADASGNGINGTLTAGTSWGEGVEGNAFVVDATHKCVTAPTGICTGNSYTWFGRFKPTAFPTPGLGGCVMDSGAWQSFSFGNGAYGWRFVSYYSSSVNNTIEGITPQDLNKWYTVAAVRDAVAMKMRLYVWVDGSLYQSEIAISSATAYWGSSTAFEIGRTTSTHSFIGLVDDVKTFNRVLSLNEITSLYNGGGVYQPVGTSLKLWMPFQDSEVAPRIGTNFTEYGTVDLIDGKHGKAADFVTASSSYLTRVSEVLNVMPISVLAWIKIKPGAGANDVFVNIVNHTDSWTVGQYSGWAFFVSTAYKLQAYHLNSGATGTWNLVAPNVLSTDIWYRVGCSIQGTNGGKTKIYLNGVKIAEVTTTAVYNAKAGVKDGIGTYGYLNSATQAWHQTQAPGCQIMSDLRVYNRLLSENEFAQDYFGKRGAVCG